MKKVQLYKGIVAVLFSSLVLVGCQTPQTSQMPQENEPSTAIEKETSNTVEKETPLKEKKVEKENVKKPTGVTKTQGTTKLVPVEFVRIVDGDTIKVMYDGEEKSVRYLLIDTPETSHPRLGKQPYGEEAKAYNASFLEKAGAEVSLEFDVGGRMDRYGRLLAYVYVNGEMLQEKLVREGLARVGYVYPPSTRHLDRLEKAQAQAKKEKKNIWSTDGIVNESGEGYTTSGKKQTSTGGNTVVRSATGKKTGFANCTELREVYPDGVPKSHKAYQANMDRDKDGYACER